MTWVFFDGVQVKIAQLKRLLRAPGYSRGQSLNSATLVSE